MLTVGQRLKTEREKQGLSLKDVEMTTSIRSLYLEAIERDDFAAVPGEVYLKGFIRNYAIAVLIDPDEMLAQYKEQTNSAAPEATPVAESAEATRSAAPRGYDSVQRMGIGQAGAVSRRINWGRVVVLGAILLALFGGIVYWYVSNISEQKKSVQTAALAKGKPGIPAAISPGATAAKQNQSLKLELAATDNCWTEVVADGKQVYSGMLQKGQKAQWEAKEMVRVKVGNAGAVQVNMNGRSLPALGKQGEVVERVFSLADA